MSRIWTPWDGPPNEEFKLRQDSDQASGLVSWWTALQGADGAVWKDLASGVDLGVASSGATPTRTPDGEWGQAYSFDGGDYFYRPDDQRMKFTTQLSLACWCYPTSTSGTQDLISWTPAASNGWELQWANGGFCYFWLGVGGSWGFARSAVPAVDTPHLLVGTWDGATIRLYLDGEEVNSAAKSGTLTTSGTPVAIGAAGRTLGTAPFFGRIPEARIYNRALPAALIRELWYDQQARWELYEPVRTPAVWFPVGAAWTRDLSETLSLTDGRTLASTRELTETLALTELRLLAATRNLAELLELADARALAPGKALAETLSLTDDRGLGAAKSLAETVTLSDPATLLLLLTLELAESLTLADARTSAAAKALTESLGLTEARSLVFSKTAAETLTLTDTGGRGLAKALAEAFDLADGRTLAPGKLLAETVSFADAVETLRSLGLNLAETLTFTDGRSFDLAKALAEALALSDRVVLVLPSAGPVSYGGSVSFATTWGGTVTVLVAWGGAVELAETWGGAVERAGDE